jgi:hypothetical protein
MWDLARIVKLCNNLKLEGQKDSLKLVVDKNVIQGRCVDSRIGEIWL